MQFTARNPNNPHALRNRFTEIHIQTQGHAIELLVARSSESLLFPGYLNHQSNKISKVTLRRHRELKKEKSKFMYYGLSTTMEKLPPSCDRRSVKTIHTNARTSLDWWRRQHQLFVINRRKYSYSPFLYECCQCFQPRMPFNQCCPATKHCAR